MNLIFKIAWRNIFRHKRKSLIIGVILFLGSLIMTLGNGVISGMDKGLRQNILNRFTGHVLLISKNQKEDSVLLTPMGKSIEAIHDYSVVKTFLKKQDYVDKFTPVAKGAAMVLNEDGEAGWGLVVGVNFAEYQKTFDNLDVVEGRLLAPGERGLLIPEKQRKEFFEMNDFWTYPEGAPLPEKNLTPEAKALGANLVKKDSLIYMGFSENNTTLDVRVPVRGVVKFKALNGVWGNYSIVDIESIRETLGYITAGAGEVKLSKEKEKLLSLEGNSLENLFSEDSFFEANSAQKIEKVDWKKKEPGKENAAIDLDLGAYNIVFVKLKPGIKVEDGVKRINDALKTETADVRAIPWNKSIGPVADMATVIRGALFGFVMLLFFVAIIIIMNTLSMAALERVPEIGMMRAVGAKRGFIRQMFMYETGMLSFVFGGAGIVLGVIVTFIVSKMNITTANDILQLLYGGDVFNPMLGATDILLGVIQLGIVTLLSIIYPVRIAGKITPLDAITRD